MQILLERLGKNMAKRIIYIPRTRTEAETKAGNGNSMLYFVTEWIKTLSDKVEKGTQITKASTAFIRCWGESLPGNAGQTHPGSVTAIDTDGQIYIYAGHGLAGVNGAGWPDEPDLTKHPNTKIVTAEQIAERLTGEGWAPASFQGKIKVYSCWSGLGDDNGNPPFAQLVAIALRGKNWTNCSYFGYMTKVSARFRDFSKYGFKTSAIPVDVPEEKREGWHLMGNDDRPGHYKLALASRVRTQF
jgi:hypothetical protein